MRNDITATSENIVDFFKQTSLNDYIKKAWLYNENCFVVDFEYKSVKFALDFSYNQTIDKQNLNVDFVLRSNPFNFTISATPLYVHIPSVKTYPLSVLITVRDSGSL